MNLGFRFRIWASEFGWGKNKDRRKKEGYDLPGSIPPASAGIGGFG